MIRRKEKDSWKGERRNTVGQVRGNIFSWSGVKSKQRKKAV